MDSFQAIIDAWPSQVALSEELTKARGQEISIHVVQKWRARDSIPPQHWRALIAAGKRRGLKITPEKLLRLAEG